MSAIANMARLPRRAPSSLGRPRAFSPSRRILPRRSRSSPASPRRCAKNGTGERRKESKRSARSTGSGHPTSSSDSFSRPARHHRRRARARPLDGSRTGCRRSPKSEARATVEKALGEAVDKLYCRVRAAGRCRLDRAGAQGEGAPGRRSADPGRGQGAPARHRAALPAGPRQLFLRRAHDRARPSALAPAAADRRGRHALPQSVAIEMDLRIEAAAISEMAEKTTNDQGFRVPKVDWARTARRVLTLEWIDGIPIADRDGACAPPATT